MPFLNNTGLASKVFIVFLIIAFASCADQQGTTEENHLPAGFPGFYDAFHSDSRYQLSHIAFPLEREMAEDTAGTPAMWTAENWVLHHHFMNDGNYAQQFNVLTDDLVVETIQRKDAPIGMQRTFARMSDGWNLIKYREMGPISTSLESQ